MGVIQLDTGQYVELLVDAGRTDPEEWPEAAREGAGLLARIREIESDCRDAHGEWDWELLSAKIQDEYDLATTRLDMLLHRLSGEELLSSEDVFPELASGHR